MKQSLWQYLQLPFELDKIIFFIFFALILSTILPGKDFGVFQVPKFNKPASTRLRWASIPIATFLVLSLLPLIPIPMPRSSRRITISVEDEDGAAITNAVVTVKENPTYRDTSDALGLIEIDSADFDKVFIVRLHNYQIFRENLSGNSIILKK